MASIYASASLTIAATRSKDSHGGLFGKPPPEKKVYAYKFTQGASTYSVYVRKEIYHGAFEDSEMPILQRAWAFQERLLSKRLVHFGDEELHWECLSKTVCECDHLTPNNFLKMELMKGIPATYYRGKVEEDDPVLSPQHRWRQIVSQYCVLSLSYDKDAFPAIQGVAKCFQAERRCAYYAGLWEDTLLHDLLWYNREGTTKFVPYRAPSWSWASNYYPKDARGQTVGLSNAEIRWSSFLKATLEERASVVSVSTISVGCDPFGQINLGTLRLRGRCMHAAERLVLTEAMDLMELSVRGISQEEQPCRHERGLFLKRTDGKTTEILTITPPYEWHYDCLGDDKMYTDILLMETANDETWSASLAFSALGSERPDTFERVGMATIQTSLLKNAFQEWGEDMTLTIL